MTFQRFIEPKNFQQENAENRFCSSLGRAWNLGLVGTKIELKSLYYIMFIDFVSSIRNDGVTGSNPLSGTTFFSTISREQIWPLRL